MKCKTWKFSTYASTKQKQKNKKAHFHNKGNKYFYHPQSLLEPFGNPSFLSPPCPVATTDGLSVAVDQLKFSVNWNMSICLVFFTEHNDFEVHSYYCMYQYSIPFYWWSVSLWVDTLSHHMLLDLWVLSGVWLLCVKLLWIPILLWNIYIFNFLG